MSGKSTLLRSIGTAAVLAQAGGPVCAASLTMSPLRVRTSLQVRDSVRGGTSRFFAELHKLREVVADARKDAAVLFLLDEVLHGTNSRERVIGARWLAQTLLEAGSIGAISTHDLELCRLQGSLADLVQTVHFCEEAREGKLVFDFKLRPGPVREGNALRLMRQLGLAVPEEPTPPG